LIFLAEDNKISTFYYGLQISAEEGQ